MNTSTKRPGAAERFGHRFGRLWPRYLDCGRPVANWLVARGVPAGAAFALLWIVKLVALGLLLYAVLWLVLLLIFMAAVAWSLTRGALNGEDRDSMVPNDVGELRGTLGYDPNLYNDASHEMYRKDD